MELKKKSWNLIEFIYKLRRELREVERSISGLRNLMDKISVVMHKKEQTADSLMQENKVQEIEFIAELRELEHELVTKQNQLEELEMNKKRLQARVKN